MKKTKKFLSRKELQISIYCVDGPCKGQIATVLPNKRKVIMPMTTDPFYETAIYMVTNRINGFGEYFAVFSHCRKRK